MKTLIIAGTAKPVYHQTEGGRIQNTEYNVSLYGQSPDHPLCVFITQIKEELRGYDELQVIARAKYCKYFEMDLNNIISLETLIMI